MKRMTYLLACVLYTTFTQAEPLRLQVQPRENQVLLNWPGSYVQPSGETIYPLYQVQQSADLKTWRPVGPLRKGDGSLMSLLLDVQQPGWFFRISADLNAAAEAPTGDGGGNVFGYNSAFHQQLAQIGQILPTEFANRYAQGFEYLPSVHFDPTTARFWDRFATDPAANNAGLSPTNHGYRYFDFRLNAAETAVLRQNGFMVSARLSHTNFAEPFYQLWNDDMPVFVSTDALLQAWHRSYENMLIELEYRLLYNLVSDMLGGMAAQIPTAQREATQALQASLLDADYFLSVALSLLRGTNVASQLGQTARVNQTLSWIAGEGFGCVTIFDYPRYVDFSQFKPRGHYEENQVLRRYFKTVMWLGRMDLRVAGEDQDCDGMPLPASKRQLGAAVVLTRLLALADQIPAWQQFDKVIQTFVGTTDSMTFAHLQDLMAAAGIQTLTNLGTESDLADFQMRIEQGELGVQHIRGDAYVSPPGGQLKLPRSFTVFGQKFVIDSWALTKVVYDDILWTTPTQTNKVARRVASALDVAFSVLNNKQVVPELVARMTDSTARASTDHSVRFRDGYDYQHNLAAAREVINSLSANFWESNIYVDWLACLRELSRPTVNAAYPQAMRTRAWALRTLNTQLASWTHLRHNTVLYAKPPYTTIGLCSYPAAYVEPRVPFWARLEQMATRTANLLQNLPQQNLVTNQVVFLRHFASHIAQLRVISEQELRHEPLTTEQLQFMNNFIQNVSTNYSKVRTYDGWYPSLFYRHSVISTWDGSYFYPLEYGATKYDALVADAHTDTPSPVHNDPGGILHQAVGKVHLLYLVVEHGGQPTIYAGPVLSHYEFETPFPQRLTDNEWKQRLNTSEAPPHPEWTRTWLVPNQ